MAPPHFVPPRRELKYIIPAGLIAPIREFIAPFCVLDPNCAKAADSRYAIISLYFDTRRLLFYRAKEDRDLRRFKLRVRGYPGSDTVFFEVKRKRDEVIAKARAPVPLGDWQARLCDGPGPLASAQEADFIATWRRFGAEPLLLARYSREAWVSVVDGYARVTFDSQLRWIEHRELTLPLDDNHPWRAEDDPASVGLDKSALVLELKYAEAAPRWMVNLVRTFDLHQTGYSKYCTGVEQLRLRDVRFSPQAREPRWGPLW